MSTGVQTATILLSSTAQAAERATQALLAMQYDDGYWWAELTADTTLEADWLLLQLWLNPPQDGIWNPPCQLPNALPGGTSLHPFTQWRAAGVNQPVHTGRSLNS